MLANELTQSLREGLLQERRDKSSTANAVLKRQRRYTDVNIDKWKEYWSREALAGYQGW